MKKNKNYFSLISLFSGIGGFELGFEPFGFDIVLQCEIDKNCQKLLQSKWPNAILVSDIKLLNKNNYPITQCDLITFGFPCQDLSIANSNRSGLKGEQSGLFYEAVRVIREFRPTWLLFENVPGLLTSNKGIDFFNVLYSLEKCGYSGAWRILDAQWFGVPQRRRRIFGLFCNLDFGAQRCAKILSISKEMLTNNSKSKQTQTSYSSKIIKPIETSSTINDNRKVTFFNMSSFTCNYKESDKSSTLVAHLSKEPTDLIVDSKGVRKLTPLECERLQGFPDNWTYGFADTIRYKMIGNSICVNIIKWIAKRLIQDDYWKKI